MADEKEYLPFKNPPGRNRKHNDRQHLDQESSEISDNDTHELESNSTADSARAADPDAQSVWQDPDAQYIKRKLANIEDNNPSKKAWQALFESTHVNENATTEWFPFENELGLMLFIARYDPQLSLTREHIKFFLLVLRTLQNHGILDTNYFVPKSAYTIETWKKYIPKPPFCMLLFFVILALSYE